MSLRVERKLIKRSGNLLKGREPIESKSFVTIERCTVLGPVRRGESFSLKSGGLYINT